MHPTKQTKKLACAAAHALTALFWLACCYALAPTALAETVAQGFSKAQAAADGGKPKLAMQQLLRLLHRYPDHEPSRLLLAHLYYTNGQVAKAAGQYRRLGPTVITPDIAYEYGISFFVVKDCSRAVPGFKQVPARSKEGNIALFYLGICALNAYECQKAEVLLSKARELPASLEATRKKALAKASARSCQAPPPAAQPMPSQPATLPPAYYGYPQVEQTPLPNPGQGPTAPTAAAPAAAADKPVTGLTTYIEPGVYLKQRNKTANYFGYKNGNSQTLNEDVALRAGGIFQEPPSAPGGYQSALSLDLNVEQNWGQTSGTSVTYVNADSQSGTLYSQGSTVPPGSTHVLILGANPEGTYALQPWARLFGGGKLMNVLPDIDSNKSITFTEGYAGTEFGDKITTVFAKASLIAVTLAKAGGPGPVTFSYADDQVYNTFVGSVIMLDANVLHNSDRYTTQAKFNYTSYSPSNGYFMSGPTASNRIDLIGSESLKIGLKLTLDANYTLMSQVGASVPDPSGVKTAPSVRATASGGASYGVKGQADIKPLDWCFAMVSYSYTNASYSGLDPTYLSAFQQVVAQVNTTFALQIGLDKKF